MKALSGTVSSQMITMKQALSLLLGLLITVTPVHAKDKDKDKDKNKDTIELSIIENRSYRECIHSGNTVLSAKFKLKTQDTASLVLEGSEDNVVYYELTRKTLEKGRGTTLLRFDAGQCIRAIRATFQ